MKKYLLPCVVILSVVLATTGCNGSSHECRTVNDSCFGTGTVIFDSIAEYIEIPGENYYVDSVKGYSTFSAKGDVVIVPQEITEKQYRRLLTDKYTIKSVAVDTSSALFAKLYKMSWQSVKRYNLVRGFITDEDTTWAEPLGDVGSIWHYPATRQYRVEIWAPMTSESFMMTEDGVIDTTFMQSESASAYGTNGVFVGQTGHDCDFHGSLWFHKYDGHGHMIPICHYMDFRWSEDGADFNLCWISDTELLVAAVSNGNSTYGWVGGYKPTDLAPQFTPVYYKLTLTVR